MPTLLLLQADKSQNYKVSTACETKATCYPLSFFTAAGCYADLLLLQADKSQITNGFVKPRQHVSPSQRTSVTFRSPDWLTTEPIHMTPETEVNADIMSLGHMNSVSELDGAESADPLTPRGSGGQILARSCSQTLARSSSQTLARSRSQTLARSRSQNLVRSSGQTLARSRSQIPASSCGQIPTRGGGQNLTTAVCSCPFHVSKFEFGFDFDFFVMHLTLISILAKGNKRISDMIPEQRYEDCTSTSWQLSK